MKMKKYQIINYDGHILSMIEAECYQIENGIIKFHNLIELETAHPQFKYELVAIFNISKVWVKVVK